MRLFLSLPIPNKLIQRLVELQSQLESSDWELKCVAPENFHLTLHFLGETPVNILNDLHHELSAVAHRLRPFDLACGGLGAFPSFEDPRVLWVGLQDRQGKLKGLVEATRKVLDSYRLFKLRDDFQARLTLARVVDLKESWDPGRLARLAPQWADLGDLAVEAIRLMKSELGQNGAGHELIEEYKLKN